MLPLAIQPGENLCVVLIQPWRGRVDAGPALRHAKARIDDRYVLASFGQAGNRQRQSCAALGQMGEGCRLAHLPHHAAGNAGRAQQLLPLGRIARCQHLRQRLLPDFGILPVLSGKAGSGDGGCRQ